MSLSDYRSECEAATARDDSAPCVRRVRIDNTEEETRGLEGMIQVTAQQLSNGPCYPVIIWMASTQNPSENAGATLRVYNQHPENSVHGKSHSSRRLLSDDRPINFLAKGTSSVLCGVLLFPGNCRCP